MFFQVQLRLRLALFLLSPAIAQPSLGESQQQSRRVRPLRRHDGLLQLNTDSACHKPTLLLGDYASLWALRPRLRFRCCPHLPIRPALPPHIYRHNHAHSRRMETVPLAFSVNPAPNESPPGTRHRPSPHRDALLRHAVLGLIPAAIRTWTAASLSLLKNISIFTWSHYAYGPDPRSHCTGKQPV
jgi:hypothetical protein